MQTIIKDKIAANKIYAIILQVMKPHFVSIQHSLNKQTLYLQQKINGIHDKRRIKAIINKIIMSIPLSIKSLIL